MSVGIERVKNLINKDILSNLVNTIVVDRVDGVMNFDGVNDYIDLGDGVETGLEHTVSTWVSKNVDNSGIVMGKRVNEYTFYLSSPTLIGVNITPLGESGNFKQFIVPPMTNGQWYNLTFTRSGSFGELFINGVSQGTHNGFSSLPSSNFKLNVIGNEQIPASSFFFNGQISQVKIYNRVLTPEEIKNNYDELQYRFR